QPGPWERLPFCDPHTEGPRDRSDLVFVEVSERLDQLELHVRGKARDVVMGLDSVPQPAAALDPVRRDRPLDEGIGVEGLCRPLDDEALRVERHSPSVRESSRTHFFVASRWSLSFSARRSSLRARISTARIPAFSPRSRPTAATGTPGGICDTLRTASRLSLPLTGTPMTGFVVWAAIVPGRAAESPATPMKTRAVVFRIMSRRRS